MSVQFTNPRWLLLLLVAVPWVLWLAWKSDVQTSPWRRVAALVLRLVIVLALIFSVAGAQWLRPQEGLNIFFLLDRSDSVPSAQQEAALNYVKQAIATKQPHDQAGVIVFGSEASIELNASAAVKLDKILAVVPTVGTDLAAAIRLGTAAFPETGQRRLVVLSDGNENAGDAVGAVLAARPLGVTLDALPLGAGRGNDVLVQKVSLPNNLKKGQTFEVKIFAQSDQAQPATVRLYRNDQLLGEQRVQLEAGKNLFTFPQTLTEQGFYGYDVQVEAAGDTVPQNNRAAGYTAVRGDPRVLLLSTDPKADQPLAAALRSSRLEVKLTDLRGLPATLAEMQSYDAIFLSNVAAGDLSRETMRLLESAVRDFGVGLVCVGGEQTYGAGGYRGTPLEAALPVNMELDSKKVLPRGALVLVMHGMEFMNGNQVARDIALGALDALGPQDELGVVLWDGDDRWLFPLTPRGNGKELGAKIAGMNQGDLPSFQHVMEMGYDGLKKSTANLKHMVVFSDGDPNAPTLELMNAMVADKITVSTVMIAGHVPGDRMAWIAENGRGRFYDVTSPAQLPQIFIKEAAVILKSAIYEEPFRPQSVAASELLRGINAAGYPPLRGYVATTPKPRAETPLITGNGDPLLAHWQYGLGRAVAFTSDAKAKWATDWLGWEQYRQFWSQIAQWSLRKLDASDFTAAVALDNGQGTVSVEALDPQGNYRNFLNLQTIVVDPKGGRQTVRLEQTGPGRYEGKFPTKEIGAYQLNLMDLQNGQIRGGQTLGASVNYSPEFNATEPNLNLLRRVTEAGAGQLLDLASPGVSPFAHDRQKTFQPRELWEWLLKLAILLFPLDVGVRRIQLDRAELRAAGQTLRRWLRWRGTPRATESDEALAALLTRRGQVRSVHTPTTDARPELFQPRTPATIAAQPAPPTDETTPSKTETPTDGGDSPTSTATRLLDAKRRAQKRRE